tara:strand:+ start:6262 stop:7401 length:1140 start_codon:yes stop_codon:yes gene_type:complete
MKFEHSLYQKPLSMTGFGGGATSLSVAGAAGGNPFDNMSNFPGATRVGTTNVIYYSSAGTTYSFTDPNGGASTFRFTAVGGGGSSNGDAGGWYGVIGGGGGGAARGEIQTSQTLNINVGYGGGSPAQGGLTGTAGNNSTYVSDSVTGQFNNYDRVRGRGGVSYVSNATSGTWLIYGTGGMPGLYGYPPTAQGDLQSAHSTGYGVRNGGRGFWENGGYGTIASGGGVTVNNGSTEAGGTGGCAAHKDSGSLSYTRHPLDLYNTYSSHASFIATAGQNTTYAGPGGGGGSDYEESYENASQVNTNVAGAAGGTASGLNTLLSGSGLSSAGGNGANSGSNGTQATRGTVGGGSGGNSRHNANSTWDDNFVEGNGIIIVEYLG